MASLKAITRTISGKKYQYYDIGQGSPAVILIHGIAANKDQLVGRVDSFGVETRYILPDLPGHNDIPLDGIENLKDTALYIKNLVDDLQLDSVVVVGYSLGGLIALKCGEVYSDTSWLRGVVAWASPIIGLDGISKEGRILISRVLKMNEGMYGVITKPLAIKFSALVSRIGLSEVEIEAMSEYSLKSAKKQIEMIKKEKYDLNTDVETLLVYGSGDRLISESDYAFALENKGEKMEVLRIENGGHFGTKEGIREAIEEIGDFVRKFGKNSEKG